MAEKKDNVAIQVSPELARPFYSNLAQVGHTQEEFFIDFLAVVGQTGTLNARIALSPTHFKRVVKALQENLGNYETTHGEIEVRDSEKLVI